MCRSIKTLRDSEKVTATDQEVYEAALQFVRKISGYRKPATRNEDAFNRAVEEISASSRKLLDELLVKR
jgi:hypothetical protein